MICNVEILENTICKDLPYKYSNYSLHILKDKKINNSFRIKFTFKKDIVLLRSHDYKWVKPSKNYVSSLLCPKVLKLKNGFYVQANLCQGTWSVCPKRNNVLYWSFNQEYQKPIAQYFGEENNKKIMSYKESIAISDYNLLFTKKPMEFSRSKYNFNAVICFTDHSDFDTVSNLKTLRVFFKKNNIKVTKGFFLNHFSKRADNASLEVDIVELEKWIADGHELAYHSLTQSLRKKKESMDEFYNFTPVNNCNTWIDHGFQYYNLSLANKYNSKYIERIEALNNKGLQYFWSYIDNGISQSEVINQLNPNHFTLETYHKGLKEENFFKKWIIIIKVIYFYYYNSISKRKIYTGLSSNFKKFQKKKSFKNLINFFTKIRLIVQDLINIYIGYNSTSKKVFPLSKFSTIFFKIKEVNSYIFQTLEMNDFVNGLSFKNQDILIKEAGFTILHTYFSVPFKYHNGRLLINNTTINPEAEKNFRYLSENIKQNKIWNPTLKELMDYCKNFYDLELGLDKKGEIYEKSNTDLLRRFIS